MCIKIFKYLYTIMKIYQYIEMHGEKYFCENIKEHIKTKSIKICTLCKKCIWQNMLDF